MNPNTDPDALLTVKQVAARLGCSQATVYMLLDRGELPFVPIGMTKGYPAELTDDTTGSECIAGLKEDKWVQHGQQCELQLMRTGKRINLGQTLVQQGVQEGDQIQVLVKNTGACC